LDWPDDVTELADALGLNQFAVGGISGGGPYVAACAFKISHRLTKAGIVSGGGPTDTPEGTGGMSRERQVGAVIARLAPRLLPTLLGLLSNPHRDPVKFFEGIYRQSSDTDQVILARPEIRAMLVENWLEATRPGLAGYAHEARLFSTPWGFQLQDISMLVHLWHGTDDHSTPLSMAYHVWHTIPHCRAKFFPGEGHFLLFDHWEEILATLVA
jgi:pimeloyl-ACP methyl ester carboxylesterase